MASEGAGTIRIGISGWTYPPWRGVFYPKGWPQKRELEYAAKQVNSIEINGSFYSLQKPESYQAWAAATPDDFVFSVKGSRYITHLRRLKEIEVPLANFFASGVLLLGQKLGPFLWQLPPSMPYDPDRLDKFLKLLPRDTSAAARLARKHDQRVSGRKGIKSGGHCILRNKGLRGTAARSPGRPGRGGHGGEVAIPRGCDQRFRLCPIAWRQGTLRQRLHHCRSREVGAENPGLGPGCKSGIGKAHRPSSPSKQGRADVFVYFDNDVKVHAPFDAIALAHRLGLRQSERV
jgi:uncharacterized protein YecE (DUF72 family)